jgi:hypothetical protein
MQSSPTTAGGELGAPPHEEGVRKQASMRNSRPRPYTSSHGRGLPFSEAKPRSETSLTDVANDVAQKRHAGSLARCMPQ